MATRAVSTVVTYRAWDTSANTPKTGDALNHTLRWIKDGTSAAPTNSPAEVDSTNAPGVYKLTLTATETDCVFGVLSGKSGTASVSIFGVQIGFEYVPTSSTTFGAFIGNATAALVVDGSGHVTAGTVSDKTGYSLSQAFPTNFSAMAITPAGALTVGTNNDKTGYTASTVSDKTGYSLSQTFPTNFAAMSIDATGNVATTSNVKKNTAKNGFMFVMTDSTTHAPKTGLTVTATRSLDGAAFAACANAVTEVATGTYAINLAAADTNADHVMLRFTATGADDLNIEIVTQP